MITIRDISEIYYEDREQHLNKKVFVDTGNEIKEVAWIHNIGDKIILTLKK